MPREPERQVGAGRVAEAGGRARLRRIKLPRPLGALGHWCASTRARARALLRVGMVLQRTLESVLTYFTSQYVASKAQDVKFGIRGGHLVLDNVELRRAALDQLAASGVFGYVAADEAGGGGGDEAALVPRFRFTEGRVRRLRIEVPWSALGYKPVAVFVEELTLRAEPSVCSRGGERGEGAGEESARTSPRERAPPRRGKDESELDRVINEAMAQDAEDPRWSSSLLARVLANMHLEIDDVVVEWSAPARAARPAAFRCVAAASALCARSAQPDWTPGFADLDVPLGEPFVLRKLIEVRGAWVKAIPHALAGGAEMRASVTHGVGLRDEQHRLEMHPVLDGFSVRVRYALHSDAISASAHHVDVDCENARVSGSARQLAWLSHWFFGSIDAALDVPPSGVRVGGGGTEEYDVHDEQQHRRAQRRRRGDESAAVAEASRTRRDDASVRSVDGRQPSRASWFGSAWRALTSDGGATNAAEDRGSGGSGGSDSDGGDSDEAARRHGRAARSRGREREGATRQGEETVGGDDDDDDDNDDGDDGIVEFADDGGQMRDHSPQQYERGMRAHASSDPAASAMQLPGAHAASPALSAATRQAVAEARAAGGAVFRVRLHAPSADLIEALERARQTHSEERRRSDRMASIIERLEEDERENEDEVRRLVSDKERAARGAEEEAHRCRSLHAEVADLERALADVSNSKDELIRLLTEENALLRNRLETLARPHRDAPQGRRASSGAGDARRGAEARGVEEGAADARSERERRGGEREYAAASGVADTWSSVAVAGGRDHGGGDNGDGGGDEDADADAAEADADADDADLL